MEFGLPGVWSSSGMLTMHSIGFLSSKFFKMGAGRCSTSSGALAAIRLKLIVSGDLKSKDYSISTSLPVEA